MNIIFLSIIDRHELFLDFCHKIKDTLKLKGFGIVIFLLFLL